MDETIFKIVKSRLARWEGQTLDQEKLGALRSEIYQRTKTNKFAPFANIKKWVKETRKRAASEAKAASRAQQGAVKSAGKSAKAAPSVRGRTVSKEEPTLPKVAPAVQASLDEIKTEMEMPRQEISMPKPTVVMDKVYLQSISFEIAAMRSAMDRIGRQLDKLEKELNQHRQGAE
jgi:hypothetical protein